MCTEVNDSSQPRGHHGVVSTPLLLDCPYGGVSKPRPVDVSGYGGTEKKKAVSNSDSRN